MSQLDNVLEMRLDSIRGIQQAIAHFNCSDDPDITGWNSRIVEVYEIANLMNAAEISHRAHEMLPRLSYVTCHTPKAPDKQRCPITLEDDTKCRKDHIDA